MKKNFSKLAVISILAGLTIALSACGGGKTEPAVESPKTENVDKDKAVEDKASEVVEDKASEEAPKEVAALENGQVFESDNFSISYPTDWVLTDLSAAEMKMITIASSDSINNVALTETKSVAGVDLNTYREQMAETIKTQSANVEIKSEDLKIDGQIAFKLTYEQDATGVKSTISTYMFEKNGSMFTLATSGNLAENAEVIDGIIASIKLK